MFPFLYVLIGYLSGLLVGYFAVRLFFKITLIIIILTTVFLLRKFKIISLLGIILITLFFIVGILYISKLEYFYDNDYLNINSEPILMNGRIVSTPDVREHGVYYKFRPEGNKRAIRLYCKEKNNLYQYGDVILCELIVEKPKGKRNPGGFDYKRYLRTEKISAIGIVSNITKIDFKPESYLLYYSIKVNENIKNTITRYIPDNKAGLITGMLLGSKENLSEESEQNFRKAGLSHLLTVSGGHAVLVLVPLSYVLKALKLDKGKKYVLEIIFLIIFAFITGLGVSICRAVIMFVLNRSAFLLRKNYDSLNALILSCILQLFYNPYFIFSPGFQLSYVATLFLILLPNRILRKIKNFSVFKYVPKKSLNIFIMSLSAQIGVIPITATIFGKISLFGVLANIIVMPFVSLLYIMGFPAIILGLINIKSFQFVCRILFYSLYTIAYSLEKITQFFGNLEFCEFKYSLAILNCIAYYLIFFYLYNRGFKISKKNVVIFALAILLVFLPYNSYFRGLELTFIDVGQGDSILMRLPGFKTVLVDTGPSSIEPTSVLRYRNIKKIDMLFLTHAHKDHIGGAIDIINEFKVRLLILPSVESYEEFNEVIEAAKLRKIKISYVAPGDRFEFDTNTYIEVIAPIQERIKHYTLNNSSLVLKLKYNNFSALFTGDIEKEAELDILNYHKENNLLNKLDVHVLKVAHHGSNTSSNGDLLEFIDPEISVITVGEGNKFNHPSFKTLSKLEEYGNIYRTDLNGAVIIRTNGKVRYSINCYLKG